MSDVHSRPLLIVLVVAAVLLTALIAWLPRIDLLLSFLVAIVGFVQAGLASAHEWVGGQKKAATDSYPFSFVC